MKKLMKILGVILFASVILTSCGGSKSKNAKSAKEFSIKPITTYVKGDLSDFFEVVDGTYKLEKAEGSFSDFKLKVQLKRKEPAFDFDAKDLESRGYFNLYCNFKDEGGTPIIQGVRAYEGMKEITTLKPGETGWVEFSFSPRYQNYDIEKVTTFEINSTVNKGMSQSNTSNYSEDTETGDEVSNTSNDKKNKTTSVDYNKFLNDYENLVNKYINLVKKVNAGDISAMDDAYDILEEAESLAYDLEDAKDEMTTAQMQRFVKIQAKLAKAINELE